MLRQVRRLGLTLSVLAVTAASAAATPAPPAAAPEPSLAAAGLQMDDELRRKPGEQQPERTTVGPALPDPNRNSGLKPTAPPPEPWKDYPRIPLPDRWRLLDSLGLVKPRWYDPYNQNAIKGDKPLFGDDRFLVLSVVEDALYEYRRLPTPVGPQATTGPGSLDVFGRSGQSLWNDNLIVSLSYLKGDTTFRPPDWEYRFTPVFNINYARAEEARLLNVNPTYGRYRVDKWLGVQELFADYHLRNVSDRFDFDSLRIGIQPFSSDFRGFLFQDNEPAVRLFGTRDNNRLQYNLIWIHRLEKNTNSGLNDITQKPRNDDIYAFNIYRQDLPVPGFTSQLTVLHNRNREDGQQYYDDNGFLVRPASIGTERQRKYRVTYLGYNADGHIGRLNLTMSTYLAHGNQTEGVFHDDTRRINAAFAAAEASMDFDWVRLRLSGVWGSGDHNPYNNTATGFDAIFENPIIAGADTSFWIRQGVPLVAGGGVTLATRNGVLNDLRSSKDLGQSNFENPGVILLGLGADFDLSPQLRLSGNFNHLWFDSTAVLELARNQGNIHTDIGWDLSSALIWRPFFTQNIVVRLSGAYLLPGQGFRDLFPDRTGYSVLGNFIFTY